MGFSAEKTIDLEVWIPQKINIERYQAAHLVDSFSRRMKGKYKDEKINQNF